MGSFNLTLKFCISISGGGGGRGKNLKQTRSMQDIDEPTCQIWCL